MIAPHTARRRTVAWAPLFVAKRLKGAGQKSDWREIDIVGPKRISRPPDPASIRISILETSRYAIAAPQFQSAAMTI